MTDERQPDPDRVRALYRALADRRAERDELSSRVAFLEGRIRELGLDPDLEPPRP